MIVVAQRLRLPLNLYAFLPLLSSQTFPRDVRPAGPYPLAYD